MSESYHLALDLLETPSINEALQEEAIIYLHRCVGAGDQRAARALTDYYRRVEQTEKFF